ncbi:MAG: hypothetical protein H7067_07210, partial [Burkholderiales bacterium]|nr:hypothetical protein [Opitutaceae bacterium]
MSTTAPTESHAARLRFWGGLALGAVLLLAAWAVPVHLRSLAPALLREAGAGTATLGDLGEARLDAAQPGPAA